jgi:hypothetical protein
MQVHDHPGIQTRPHLCPVDAVYADKDVRMRAREVLQTDEAVIDSRHDSDAEIAVKIIKFATERGFDTQVAIDSLRKSFEDSDCER